MDAQDHAIVRELIEREVHKFVIKHNLDGSDGSEYKKKVGKAIKKDVLDIADNMHGMSLDVVITASLSDMFLACDRCGIDIEYTYDDVERLENQVTAKFNAIKQGIDGDLMNILDV